MKKVISFIIVLIISAQSFSQKNFFSIGPELALPNSVGLKTNAGTGIGGSLRFEFDGSKHIAGLVTIGYLGFAQKELAYSGTQPTTTRYSARYSAIPIQVGVKYYTKERKETPKGFFISAELGIMPTTIHFDYLNIPDRDFKESGLSTAIGIGYQLGKIEAGFRGQYNFSASGFDIYYYNFRIAYAFLKRKVKGLI